MQRRDYAWGAVLLWLLVGPRLLAGDRVLLTDEPEAKEWFVAQPVPGSATDDPTRSSATGDAARSAATPATRSTARSSYARQARAPNMFGDSFGNGGQLSENAVVFFVPQGGTVPVACACGNGDLTDLPPVGGGVIKVTENNKPIPMDRVYFVYNGFQNALSVGQPVPRDVNINRYTLGFEKTFHDRLWSVNVGIPLYNSLALSSDAFSANSGSLGNLAVFLKRLVYSEDGFAVSTGVGISLPTGSDLAVQTHQFNPIRAQDDVQNIVIHNQAVHLVPYVGFLDTASDDWFFQGFLSLNFAANGNQVDLGTPASDVGTLNEQHLFHIDFTAGRWLLQNPDAYYLNGVAAIAEAHYTSTIQNTDSVTFPTSPDTGPFVNGQLSNLANQTDILNLTAGVHFQIGNLSNLRVACVIPVQDQPYRQFDSEIQISFNRFF